MNRTRGAVGSLALAALLGMTLAGSPSGPIAAQDATETPTAPATTNESQTQADADAAAIATGKYPFGTHLLLLDGQASVRNAAGSEAATLTEIDEGESVTVQAGPEQVGGADWYQVETEGGVTGWVDASQFAVAQGAPALDAGTERQVVTDSLNLRAQPGTSSEVVSGLVQGDTVTIVSGPQAVDDLDWYEVETIYGEDGWLAGVYLGTPGETSGTAAVGAQEGDSATPEAAATAAAFPEDSYVFIAGDGESVNLRADASIDAEIVSELADGAIGAITGAPTTAGDYDWYPVSFGTGDATVTGFVAGSLLTGGITVGSTALVADGPLNVRADTTTDGEPIAQLETGASVTVVSGPTEVDGVAWFEIQSGDTNGYVSGRYLGLTAADATETTDTPEATETTDTAAE
ncbi:MAG TPA: SH3 domain-containing protein [Thermomicrobiales bacterium]|nr:SH3 domain-containing protein [Thermomicrobiales bacterium]